MRKLIFLLIPIAGLFMFFTCEEVETEELETTRANDLVGEWQLYETGYSPGSGYVTKEVDPLPVQFIMLESDNHFASNIDGLKSFKFYYVLNGMLEDEKVLALFTEKQNIDDLELSDVGQSYSINWEDGSLKLHFRYCIEGCHMAFKKIKGDNIL